ncbi:MAG TPA: hypothetical protein VFN62_09295 [Acidobacteriaceae bacterium]|nr:hypothetical protein [Acidobacteriaceae bacterium]
MVIRRKGKAWLGLLLAVSFFAILALFCAPLFAGSNGLEQSDQLFNRLAKGSSYFIPALSSDVRSFEKQGVAISVEMESPAQAKQAMAVLSKAVPGTTVQGSVLSLNGTLAQMLGAALVDCDAMYLNHGDELRARYRMDGKEVLAVWFSTLNTIARKLQEGSVTEIAQSKLISIVVTKGVEPAFNFYGIQPENVKHRAGITTGLLLFYLIYTVWWGFAIFFMCEAIGLAMTKSRVKREV